MRRQSLAVCGDQVSADEPARIGALERAGEVDTPHHMAQLLANEYCETFSVVHSQLVEATTKLRHRAYEAN